MENKLEDSRLVKKMYKRDEKTFKYLIDTYSLLLYTVAGGYLKGSNCTKEDVEECVSDVFFELWNNPKNYDISKGSLKTYLCTLTRYKAISMYRKNKRNNVIYLEEFALLETDLTEEMEEYADYSELYAAIKKLPEPTKEILIRRFFYDEKPAVISEKMNLPKKEIENRIYRGKKTLYLSLEHLKEAKS